MTLLTFLEFSNFLPNRGGVIDDRNSEFGREISSQIWGQCQSLGIERWVWLTAGPHFWAIHFFFEGFVWKRNK